jgi:hypothetical protein
VKIPRPLNYISLGNFTALRLEVALWRIQMLREILDGRHAALAMRVKAGLTTEEQMHFLNELLDRLQIWLVPMSEEDKRVVERVLVTSPVGYKTQIFSFVDVQSELEKLTGLGA